MPKFFKIPFGASGDRLEVPDATQVDGSVSYSQGFGPDYQRKTDGTDPLAKAVPRNSTNTLFYDVTGAVGEIQLNGFALWQAEGAPYPINAVVRYSDKAFVSLISNNSVTPVAGAAWAEVALNSYTKVEIDAKLLTKADKATTLAGYGITDGATKNSPIFTGIPQAPTPSKFDSSKLIPTTEFVRNALGSLSGRVSYGSATILTSDDVGKLVMLNYSGVVQLPPVAGLPDGSGVMLFNWGPSQITVVSSIGTSMNTGTGSLSSLVLQPGTALMLFLENGSSWTAKMGDGSLPFSPLFASSVGTVSRYFKHPSGIIIQAGMASGFVSDGSFASATVTLPITFPNQGLAAVATSTGFDVSCATSLGLSSLTITNNSTALSQAHWIAIGF